MEHDEALKRSNPLLYAVAKQGATEAPFTGKYVHEKKSGVYHCAVCGAPLFSFDTKFDSNTGWPAFTDPIVREAVSTFEDTSHGMRRTEVRCRSCGAHLGHVFPDGPIVGENVCDRYCINSISLTLVSDEV